MEIFKSWLVEKYIAHRGFHTETAPENSLPAFKNAIELGYAIELDVQEISDGTIIVFHDSSLARATGKDGYTQNLKREDLKSCYLFGTKETIPTFEEALRFISGNAPILIEIKNDGKIGDLESKVAKILDGYSGEYAVQSFNPYSLAWFKQNAPSILRGQLSSYFKNEKLSFVKKMVLKKLMLNKVASPNFISYEASRLPNRFVRKYNSLPLLAWTVKSQEEYMRVVKFCDNIIFENFNPKI